jgi:RimJ/RimL family protein N-acetyltransferase
MVIETERLFLREMTEEDFFALYKVLADAEIMRHYPYVFDENRRGMDFKKYRKI